MNNISKMHEVIGKQYMELREANEARDFWFNAYTDVQEKVKEAEIENAKLRAELENVKTELKQVQQNIMLVHMLEMGAADPEEAGKGEAV